MTIRGFEPSIAWSDKNGMLTERALGYQRALFDYIGATAGTIPAGSIGAPGGTTSFYRADGTFAVPAYPAGAAPTGSVGTAPVSGTAATFLRSDAAPALSLGIVPTWTGSHTFAAGIVTTTATCSGVMTAATVASTGSLTTTTSATIGTTFGCNSKAAQGSAAANAAITATAGAAYTATEQGMLADLKALTNQIRAALVANGIMS